MVKHGETIFALSVLKFCYMAILAGCHAQFNFKSSPHLVGDIVSINCNLTPALSTELLALS